MMNLATEGDEDSEDSSSSSPLHNMSSQFKTALDEFREKWQQELKSDTKGGGPVDCRTTPGDVIQQVEEVLDDEARAERLFMHGVEFERRGKVYDALKFYRRAVHIVPDIEFRIYEASKAQSYRPKSAEIGKNSKIEPARTIQEDDEDLSDVNLYTRFQGSLQGDRLISRATPRGTISTQTHISDLPNEIIFYILRWVVGSHLDVRSLEQVAATCKGLYLCARDEELWRLICLKASALRTHSDDAEEFSWRKIFIETQRVLFNGCYISKTSYFRYGENSFQDTFYRPIQLIEYYRYIRFFPDGAVSMLTTNDEPFQTVSKLKNATQIREILKGHYKIHGDSVVIILKGPEVANKKQRSCQTDTEGGGKKTFYIELKIASTAKRRFCQLLWKRYSIIQIRNNREIASEFDLTAAKFPPLWFSRVKSYHVESEEPLM